MKCEYCGSNLGIEDEYCPHCGRLNSQAAGHFAELKKTQDDFKQAKAEATENIRSGNRTARLVIIGIMVTVIIIMRIMTAKYSDVETRIDARENEIKREAYKNKNDIDVTLKELEKNREYLAMEYYVLNYRLRSNDAYDDYARVFTAAIDYRVIYDDILNILDGFEGYENETDKDRCYDMAIYISDWDKYVGGGFWSDSPTSPMHSGEHGAFIADAKTAVQDMVQVYFELTDEQASSMWKMDRDTLGEMLYEKCRVLYPKEGEDE